MWRTKGCRSFKAERSTRCEKLTPGSSRHKPAARLGDQVWELRFDPKSFSTYSLMNCGGI
eukprot:7563237-Pyramimonas_sp.AAC.1